MSFGPGCVKWVDLSEFDPEPKPNIHRQKEEEKKK